MKDYKDYAKDPRTAELIDSPRLSRDETDLILDIIQQDQDLNQENQKLSNEIQKLSSEKSMLASKLEKVSSLPSMKQLKEQQRENAKLLKDAKDLKDRTSKMEQEISARESTVSSRERSANARDAAIESRERNLESIIESRAERKIETQMRDMQRHEEQTKEQLAGDYAAKKASLFAFTSVFSLFGFLVVFFEAIKSPAFRADFVEFWVTVANGIAGFFKGLAAVGGAAAKLGDMIPYPVLSNIVHWLLQIAVTGGLIVGIGVLLFLLFRFIWRKLCDAQVWDRITAFIIMAIAGVNIIFADMLAPVMWNLLAVILLESGIWLFIRWNYNTYKGYSSEHDRHNFISRWMIVSLPFVAYLLIRFLAWSFSH